MTQDRVQVQGGMGVEVFLTKHSLPNLPRVGGG